IRDLIVTGVQTCALPISTAVAAAAGVTGVIAVGGRGQARRRGAVRGTEVIILMCQRSCRRRRSARGRQRASWRRGGGAIGRVQRSEERRVGKEGWGGGAA